MDASDAGILVFFAILAVGVGVLGYGAYNNWQVELAYERDVGGFFEYADRASDAHTKSMYFDKYVNAIKSEGLDTGYSSILFQNQPEANLANDWNVTTSLQERLHSLTKMDENSMQYQQGIQQISTTEFCWFPTGAFEQGYAMKHGAWGDALTPFKVVNRCAPPPKS